MYERNMTKAVSNQVGWSVVAVYDSEHITKPEYYIAITTIVPISITKWIATNLVYERLDLMMRRLLNVTRQI